MQKWNSSSHLFTLHCSFLGQLKILSILLSVLGFYSSCWAGASEKASDSGNGMCFSVDSLSSVVWTSLRKETNYKTEKINVQYILKMSSLALQKINLWSMMNQGMMFINNYFSHKLHLQKVLWSNEDWKTLKQQTSPMCSLYTEKYNLEFRKWTQKLFCWKIIIQDENGGTLLESQTLRGQRQVYLWGFEANPVCVMYSRTSRNK